MQLQGTMQYQTVLVQEGWEDLHIGVSPQQYEVCEPRQGREVVFV